MAETLIPTTGLRIVERYEPTPGFPQVIAKRQVLQQRFERVRGGHVWRDVPIVTETELG